nr:hypothetical protein [uncultured Mucilaginibacter sp.]
MKFRSLIFFLFLMNTAVFAQQGGIAHFSVWKPKAEQSAKFAAGYKQHLQWHTANHDNWNWYGWYIVSGSRFGQFIDATVGHNWGDFDNPVNPSGDGADNGLHTDPFGDYLGSYKLVALPSADSGDNRALKAKLLKMYTITVSDAAAAAKLLQKAITLYRKQNPVLQLQAYKLADGGELRQFTVFVGADSYAELGRSVDFQAELINGTGSIITSITAETLIFKADMSINIK